MNLRTIFTTLFILSCLVGQQFKHQVSGSYYGRGGNSDYQYYNFNWSTTAYGDLTFGGMELNDSEFLFSLDKNNSTWQGDPYENDQSILFKFDLWANGKFSPFLIAETSFDEALGIKDRTNFGIGAKYRILGDILSISAAFLQESEETAGKNAIYLYADYGDSLGVTAYKDNSDLKSASYSRISIRPKLKLPVGENFYYQSEYYYKPAGDDILTYWKNIVTIKTAEEWLDIVIKYNVKNDSQPAPKIFMAYDPQYYTDGQLITFTNPGNGTISYDRTPEQSISDGFGDYYIKNYKANDTTITIGINITF
ncbi:MAG: hypothetical protein QF743_09055 [Candidatus Marinimicrobia bacterium]|jgi:hypothetical protein|nr:hypothetical protein [Candidatus Neomarinimicrobiota bacterium]MDP6611642.1 hypothetical protein [Candidatus Neomarinimicrobiota bacterium]|tara:strand:- start:22610 stop:23536 length:927 start_codon:yes stop_codon:yes gene_type:complete